MCFDGLFVIIKTQGDLDNVASTISPFLMMTNKIQKQINLQTYSSEEKRAFDVACVLTLSCNLVKSLLALELDLHAIAFFLPLLSNQKGGTSNQARFRTWACGIISRLICTRTYSPLIIAPPRSLPPLVPRRGSMGQEPHLCGGLATH